MPFSKRYLFLPGLIALLLLAACGAAPTPTPTATPVPPTATPVPPTAAPVPDAVLNLTAPMPIPGTLMPGAGSGTLQPLNPPPFSFDRLAFSRTGGITGTTLALTLNADGTGTRGDQPVTVPAEAVEQIRQQLELLNFFQLRGQFTNLAAPADALIYTLFVSGPQGERQITAQDGLIPPALNDLLILLTDLAAAG